MEPLSLLIMSLLFWIGSARGDLRCYCNDASCISTGYMCKSPSGKCYSRLPYDGQTGSSLHGCAESLPEAEAAICEQDGDIIKTRAAAGGQQWPILMCCSEDMCNYSDSIDIKIYVNSKSTTRNSLKGERPGPRGAATGSERGPEAEGADLSDYNVPDAYSQRLLWFRAAVIAVPIAGGFILVLLVLLAVRMLRNDSRRHRQLVQMRRHRGLTKAQLYVADHFYANGGGGGCDAVSCGGGGGSSGNKKSDRKHGRCGPGGGGGGVGGGGGGCGESGVFKDVSVKVDYNGHGYKKMLTDSSHDGSSCSSIVVWGPPDKPEPALTIV